MRSNLALARAEPPPSAVTARLESARAAVERRFVQAGDVLGDAAESLRHLIGSLDRLTAALDSETVSASTGQLNMAAGALRTLPERHAARLSHILELRREGAALAGSVEDMTRNLAYLRVFATSIKITAAGISAASREFGDFAQEICQRVEQGQARLEAFKTELQAMLALFDQAHAQENSLASRCAAVLPAVPDSLCVSAERMSRHHLRIAEVAGQIAALGRSVQGRIGSALAGLQVGDITRQRIEHVAEIQARAEAADGIDPDQRRRLDAFVNHLLAELLRAASADFHQEIARLRAALDGLAGDAGAILGLRDLAVGREGGDEGVLRRLEGDVAKAMGLVADMADSARQALTLGGSAVAAAADLGRGIIELQDIKTDVQHMALNTTLKCARIGDEGKPLAVIAVELRQHAGHIETSARLALETLDAVAHQAQRLSEGQETADAPGSAAQVGITLETVRAGLRGTSEMVEADVAALAAQGEAVAGALRAAARSLDLETEIGAVLDEAATALSARADPDPHKVGDLEAALGALLSHAAQRYTMASERQVQARIVARLGFKIAESRPAAAQAASLDDVLF